VTLDPTTRTALLGVGLAFCAFFAVLSISVAIDTGFDIFTVISLLIVGMIAAGLIGAIRNPPPSGDE
jgi:heme/copper-type cytochrome/quinol oxidase subunit 1